MKFIGHTRFNLFEPGSTEWNLSQSAHSEADQAYLERLYDEDRLNSRCGILLTQSLPQLEKSAMGHDLIHVISFSENLPGQFKDRLYSAAKRYPFVVLDERKIGGEMTVSLDILAQNLVGDGDANTAVGFFRLDDDDILSANYFDLAAQYVKPEFAGMAVSFGRGISGLYINNKFYGFRWTKYRFIALGLLFIGRLHNGRLVLPRSGNHELVDELTPTIIDSRQPAWLWAKHPSQDTRHGLSQAYTLDRIIRQLSDSDVIPEDVSLESLFPNVHGIEAAKHLPEVHEFHSDTSLDDDLEIQFDSPRQIFTISVHAKLGTEAGDKEILSSLDLYRSDGTKLLDKDVEIPGLAFNPREDIGYWRYLKTKSGTQTFSEFYLLPDGIECRGLRLKKWGSLKCKVTIEMVSIDHF